MHLVFLFPVAFAAGAINSVAGGGTLLTFPTLLATGMNSITANATSTVSLVPGSFSSFWKYRDEIKANRMDLVRLAAPSLVGGSIGAHLVVRMDSREFSHLIPYLILGATALFVLQEPIQRSVAKRLEEMGSVRADPLPLHWALAMAFQFLVSIYGGLFGAGMGILMLAALGILGIRGIHRMNALKNFAGVCINGVASWIFITSHKVDWGPAVIMILGAIAGGYLGAGLARKVGEKAVRATIIAVGLMIGIKTLLSPL